MERDEYIIMCGHRYLQHSPDLTPREVATMADATHKAALELGGGDDPIEDAEADISHWGE